MNVRPQFCQAVILVPLLAMLAGSPGFAGPFETTIRPLLETYCLDCHSTEVQKGDLDLERFTSMDVIRDEPTVWQEVIRQIADGEMPPKQEQQFTAAERTQFTDWIRATLHEIALADAGDPGPVILRRLSNHEYTYTIRDLSGVSSLDPASEFPVDGAAGEGFTNVGAALVMSPALLTKYLDAAKEVASHAVILPDRIMFSPSTSRADWTQEKLDEIRRLYSQYAVPGDETARNLQGVQFSTTDGGVIPVVRYLQALHDGDGASAELSSQYLETLSKALDDQTPALLLDQIRARWRTRKAEEIPAIAEEIGRWQHSLWHFAKVGHIGKRDGPKAWQLPVMPVATTQSIRLPMPEAKDGIVTIHLIAGDAGDGNQGDVIVWKDARLQFPSEPPIGLSQIPSLLTEAQAMQQRELARTVAYLDAIADAFQSKRPIDELARQHHLIPEVAVAWAELLRLNPVPLAPSGHLTGKQSNVGGYASILGWGEGLPVLLVNQSQDDLAFSTLRVPGRGVTVHPTPEIDSVVAWKSPVSGVVSIHGFVADMDSVCGNGSAWNVELINAYGSRKLAGDQFANGGRHEFGLSESVTVQPGDLVRLTVQARDHDHSCDTTQVSLEITEDREGGQSWNLARDIVDRIHEGNPLADSYGNPAVWHICQSQDEPAGHGIPDDSALGRWRVAVIEGETGDANAVQSQLQEPNSAGDQAVRTMCFELRGPLRWLANYTATTQPSLEASDLEQVAPSVLEFQLPAHFVAGAELVSSVALHPDRGQEGSVQAFASLEPPLDSLPLVPGNLISASDSPGTQWTDGEAPVVSDRPILVRDGSEAQKRIVRDIADFQSLFPAALCYEKIVPVDEVVTLTLRYREDEHLQRLMLNESQRAQLDRLWDEMWFVSRQPLAQLDAYNQLWQYATQDADPSAFEPMREPIQQAAAAFEMRLVDLESAQLQLVLDFAAKGWRRPLRESEQADLRGLYRHLRDQELAHEAAIRQLIARVLVAPAFLYRGETAAAGSDPMPVNDWELATRLSYFLWSSAPDDALMSAAASGTLRDPEVLVRHMQRMLADEKVRRLATEFGCQWLHVRDLESLDEKSERHFPSFVALRGDMQEEITRFFIDLFQQDRSILSLLDADHTFVNGQLASHYGLELDNEAWQRIEGMRERGRGGVLGFAGTLAKQSGASRTSPILRGNWVNEVLLGERLPRPPKNVPVLPDEAPEGLTERELIQRHSGVAECARCHERIDPFGFALEGFDGIGRSRSGLDTLASLSDGTKLDGIEGLRSYLIDLRRDDFLRQFCRKLLGYALGRSVQLSDEPLLDSMLEELKQNDDRVGTAVEIIVRSPQFRKVRGRDDVTVHQTSEEP